MQTISQLYKPTEPEEQIDTFVFEVKIYSTWRNCDVYTFKIDPSKGEDYSTAWEMVKHRISLINRAVTNKEIRLVQN